jgi:hypothetical protein
MTQFLTLLCGLLLAPVVAGLVASVLCCLSVLRNEKPPWSHAVVSTLAGLFSSLWMIFRGDVFDPSNWSYRIPGLWNSFLIVMVPSVPLTVAVVLVAVVLFQERYRSHLTISERRVLRRQRREKLWRRSRWFRLLASCALMACFSAGFVLSLSGPESPAETDVVDKESFVYFHNNGHPPSPPRQGNAARHKPLLNLNAAAPILWPVCGLGLLASAAWFAYTVAYWHGYIRVKPRRRRDLLPPYRSAKVR